MKKNAFIIVFLILAAPAFSQQIELLSTGNKTSLRGLSVVNDKIAWVSGSHGAVARTTDSGKTWTWLKVQDYEKRDFRDIEAFDKMKAIIIAVDTPAVILKTVDGGLHWKKVYENNTPGMFLDAMEFWNQQSGIVLGDPINGKFFIARTFDEGETWRSTSFEKLPAADSGEACFASSGTNIRGLNLAEACFVSGGLRSRFFWKGAPVDLPLLQGANTFGANSIAVRNPKKRKGSSNFIVVGGDFTHDTLSTKNCALTNDGGKTWMAPAVAPHGYRSCVEYISNTRLITCGTSGVDVSSDAGMNWQLISKESFHVCRKAKKGNAVFLAGNGRIARLVWN